MNPQNKHYDVIVVGAGPAGYVAAIRCSQLGLQTACIDDWREPDGRPTLGGTCLNAGCIPSKALLDSSEIYHRLQKNVANHGILIDGLRLDVAAMMSRKQRLVRGLTDGIAQLFKSNGITWLQGRGQLLDGKRVEFTPHGSVDAQETIDADHIILASGSRPIALDAAPVDGELIVDSSMALTFDEVPARLGIIGAGVIGLELGSLWGRLGAQVTLLEAQDGFLTMTDDRIAQEALRTFAKQGLDIRLGARVVSTNRKDTEVEVQYQDGDGTHELKMDKLLVAVGRLPYTDGLAAPEAGLLLDEKGCINVDERYGTNIPGVYAVGDVIRGPMLAHKGSEEGVAVAEIIAGGRKTGIDYNTVPSVVYTHPEIAWVGRTEQDLKTLGIKYRSGMFPFAASGRARAMDDPNGLVKVLADAATDRLLGVHIIGPCASELIAEAVLAMEFGASSEDVARTIHAHPTLSEALHEAALAVDGRAIHVAGSKKSKR